MNCLSWPTKQKYLQQQKSRQSTYSKFPRACTQNILENNPSFNCSQCDYREIIGTTILPWKEPQNLRTTPNKKQNLQRSLTGEKFTRTWFQASTKGRNYRFGFRFRQKATKKLFSFPQNAICALNKTKKRVFCIARHGNKMHFIMETANE